MFPGNEAHFGECRTQPGSCMQARHVVPLRPVPIENFEWNVELAAPRMNRECLQQRCESVGKPGVMSHVS